MSPSHLIERFRGARRDRRLAVLEGLHPLKHALRFDAEVLETVAPDPARILELASRLAPDIATRLERLLTVVPEEVFVELAPSPPTSGVLALARRREASAASVLRASGAAPVVLLDRPTHLGNIGAAVRVAAAAGAAGVIVTGRHDPWHPAALRGAAGLHYAIPVARADDVTPPGRASLPVLGGAPVEEAILPPDRPLVAVDADGEPLGADPIPGRAVLAFGSERSGLDEVLLRRAALRVAIPMRAGVSSLNLATAVAVVLYWGRSMR